MANHAKKNKRPAAKKGTFGRLFRYLFDHYGMRLIVVMLCIIVSAVASVIATVFLQRLIDECIVPGISSGMGAVQNLLVHILLTMAVFYVLGVLAAFTYNRIMATVTQGTLKHLRDDMFHGMETLPIPYFDTHPHGDIMSTYTNDTDAIRMLIGQSLPMLTQSVLSVLAMLGMMLYFSVWMTILVLVFIGVMLTISKKFGGASAKYMMAQQRSLATEEGFVEEIMSGQKVVQVFCHEEESKRDFVKLNEKLFHDGEKANQYGNVLMPILNNLGNLMYVLLAVLGGTGDSARAEYQPDRRRYHDTGHYHFVPQHDSSAVADHWSGIHAGVYGCHGLGRCRPCV